MHLLGTFAFFSFQNHSLNFLVLGVAYALSCVCLQIKIGHRAHTSQVVDAVPVSCVCLQIKIGHRAHTSQVVDEVPVLGTRGIHTGSKTCVFLRQAGRSQLDQVGIT